MEVWVRLPGSNSSLAGAKPGGNSANSSLPEVKSFRRVRPARVSSGSPFADDQPLPTATDLNSSAAVGGLHHLQAVSHTAYGTSRNRAFSTQYSYIYIYIYIYNNLAQL